MNRLCYLSSIGANVRRSSTRLIANNSVYVSDVKMRVAGAPLFVNFLVQNNGREDTGDVFAIDVNYDSDGDIEVSLFKRVENSLITDDSDSQKLLPSVWSKTLQLPEFGGWICKEFSRNYYRAYRTYDQNVPGVHLQIAVDIVSVINNFTGC